MTEGAAPSEDKWSQYRWLWRELWKRTWGPWSRFTFVSYFFVAMVFVGPLSVWVEIYGLVFPPLPSPSTLALGPPDVPAASLAALRTALLTYFPAVAATTAMQLVWAEGKEMRSAAVLLLAVIVATTACIYPERVRDTWAIGLSAFLTILALWLWWVANADNAGLMRGDIKPIDALGGPLEDTRHLAGGLDGFET